MKTFATILAGSALAAAAMTAPAQAAQPNTGSTNTVSCTSSEITAITTGTLLGCEGAFSGNDNLIQDTVMSALSGYASGWTYDTADKSDATGNGVFTSNPGASAGTLTFDSPVFGIFAVVLKSATASSVFVFDGGTTGIGSFGFTMDGVSVNRQGIAQGLSHASFYRSATTSFVPPTPVPEPLTLLGTAAALGLGAVMRRRTENA